MEEWRDVQGYENLYQVSSIGRVRSLNYNHTGEIKVLKTWKNKDNYLCVSLCKERKRKTFLVHRLVAETFIPNPENKSQIDHINCVRDDNYYKNLQWVTQKENNMNELTRQHKSEVQKGEKNSFYGRHHSEESLRKMSKVVEISKDGVSLGAFSSCIELERKSEKLFGTKLSQSAISLVCTGKRKHHKNFTFKFVD